jgi:hypothetical protein
MTSKENKNLTMKRNRETKERMLKIRRDCGFKRYLQLTSNGHYILSRFIRDSIPVIRSRGFWHKETLCVRALISNIGIIGDKLNEFDIILPNIDMSMSLEVKLATNSYFVALDDLFKRKPSFNKVSVYPQFEYAEFLDEEVEKMVLSRLSKLEIDFLDIRIKIRNPRLLINPSVKKLSAHQEFFTMNYFPDLLGLESIIFPDFDWSHDDMQRITGMSNNLAAYSVDKSVVLRIARNSSVKELTITSDLVSEALSNQYSIEKLNIYC